ncbi:uncharacterized protein NECHADRAFT_51335 [Fusarium vanettenii 77-13-4]|uniref:NmrA-like domain-containing protein n=1 Tax=Fusarium vanettenii (strain ATCC MYA-4622 / CBS 123669 / FGSC 9596 / NRRL 45880 / 77-13-4) TaxID=660122 RepID=C7ZEV4_FUSV7|nr:uncharacterized protein NECHADRAFT_51335 [Fusarium vanettenii 77-13-4]EEU37358.1 hypothetical protein NECHADRAFT_51335 [Fusarium vanettenii 77-13-4]
MAILAVAGGTGDVGRTLVEELVQSGKHKVIVLCRKPLDKTPTAIISGVEYAEVDYDDIEGTAKMLDSNKVDTVISALTIAGPSAQAQLNLIAATDKSSSTHRFIPSEYAGYVALDKSSLKYTRIPIGIFMDYMGLPHIPSHIRNFPWAFDFPSRRAVVSGTGNEPFTMTYSKDLALFVARLIDEDEWPEWSFIGGSDVTQNQIVALAEKALGDKLAVTHDSLEDLKVGKATVLFPSEETYGGMDPAGMMAMLGASVAEGEMLLPKEGRLNDRFPDVQTTSIDDLITRAWTGK